MNKHLKKVLKKNDSIEATEDGDTTYVTDPWNDSSIVFEFQKGQVLKPIRNLIFPEALVAIFHSEKNKLEFIYGPLGKEDDERGREFEFYFSGETFECHFSHCSKALKILSKAFREGDIDSGSNFRNLRQLRDYFNGDEFFDKYFKDAAPISFFVEGDFSSLNSDFIELSKNINFYLKYYDRTSAQIHILKKSEFDDKGINTSETLFDEFPQKISAHSIDPTLLDIFGVAEETPSPRLKFIFYFQIIEYCSYYYLREDLRKDIFKIIKDPAISNDPNYFTKVLIEEFKDQFSQRDDSVKIEKTILDYCSIEDVRKEIAENYEYFSQKIQFDGGFSIPKIVKDEESVEKLIDEDLIKIKKNIVNTRNVLVHLRESRENQVILPTDRNNYLLQPYLHLVRRLAEKIAIHFD